MTKEDNIWSLGVILFQLLNGQAPIEDPEFLGGKWRFKNWDSTLSREAFVLVNSMLNNSESDRLAIGDVVGSHWMRTIANSKGIDVDEVRGRLGEGEGDGEMPDVGEGEEIDQEKKKAIAEFNNDSAEAMESFQNIVKLETMFKGTVIICVLLLCTLFFFYWSFEDDMKIHCIVMAVFTIGLLVSALA